MKQIAPVENAGAVADPFAKTSLPGRHWIFIVTLAGRSSSVESAAP
jgi:hypothetical protein